MGLYIIGNKYQKICKIGVSKNPQRRLRTIQTGCPYRVELLLYVEGLSYESEKEYHKRYSEFKMHGEWFRISGELHALIYSGRNKKSVKKPRKIKVIPEISEEKKRKLTQRKRRGKRNSKHMKNVYNHR